MTRRQSQVSLAHLRYPAEPRPTAGRLFPHGTRPRREGFQHHRGNRPDVESYPKVIQRLARTWLLILRLGTPLRSPARHVTDCLRSSKDRNVLLGTLLASSHVPVEHWRRSAAILPFWAAGLMAQSARQVGPSRFGCPADEHGLASRIHCPETRRRMTEWSSPRGALKLMSSMVVSRWSLAWPFRRW